MRQNAPICITDKDKDETTSKRTRDNDRPSSKSAANHDKKRAALVDDIGNANTETATGKKRDPKNRAHISDLDENMQETISKYMDIYSWDHLGQSCKLLSSWPEPPPPPIKYHIIKFYFTNSSHLGYCGVAKTLDGVIDAYKHERALDVELHRPGNVTIDIQFLHLGCLDFPLVPLIEYEQRQHHDDKKPAQIHHSGKHKCFDVKEAGGDLPEESVARQMMNMKLNIYNEEDDEGKVKLFLDDDGQAAVRWLRDVAPVQDIDLVNLCFVDNEKQEECDMYEIWLFRNRRGRTEGNELTLGQDGTWAICDIKADISLHR